jgi:hypothetical protein
MNVHLAVPDLFWPEPATEPGTANAERLPALELLLARGRRTVGDGASLEAWLLDRWSAPAGAAAPYCLLADGGEPGDAFWLRADPCHLRADRDRLVLLDSTLFEVDREEADSLVASLNRHFPPGELRFVAAQPERWYARAGAESGSRTVPLAGARGRTVAGGGGDPAVRWHALENEIQMLLHAHPANEAREARGALPVNALWLWGGGRLASTVRSPFRRVRSADPLAAGLALAAHASVLPLPEDATRWLRAAVSEGEELVVLDPLRAPADYGDHATWRERIRALERTWFGPLLRALRDGKIGMITVHAIGVHGTLDVETTRQDLRHFWRRPRPLADYVR